MIRSSFFSFQKEKYTLKDIVRLYKGHSCLFQRKQYLAVAPSIQNLKFHTSVKRSS